MWAARLPVPGYAIDDETAIKVLGDTAEVVSEGHWRLFEPSRRVYPPDLGSDSRCWQ